MNEGDGDRENERRFSEWLRAKGIEAELTRTYDTWDVTARLPDGRLVYIEYKDRRPASIETYPDTVLSLKKVVQILEAGKNNQADEMIFVAEFDEGYFLHPVKIEDVRWFKRTSVNASRADPDRHNLACHYDNKNFTFWR